MGDPAKYLELDALQNSDVECNTLQQDESPLSSITFLVILGHEGRIATVCTEKAEGRGKTRREQIPRVICDDGAEAWLR